MSDLLILFSLEAIYLYIKYSFLHNNILGFLANIFLFFQKYSHYYEAMQI